MQTRLGTYWTALLLLTTFCTALLFLVLVPMYKNVGTYGQTNYQELTKLIENVQITEASIKSQTELRRRRDYPRRLKMGPCPQYFGKVLVFVAYVKSSMETHYKVAQESLQCYLKGTNYSLAMVDLDSDLRVKQACSKNKQLFFKKHCAASVYLRDADWMLVLDADTGVANPNHCIEEWIDDRVDILFYERFFNWEVASGNYLKWGDWEFTQPANWNGADNGVLQMHILQTVLPYATEEAKACDAYWHAATNYDTYMAYVTCVKLAIGATRIWPGKVRIYKRAHGWVRDGFITSDRWCTEDFMFHGWKVNKVGDSGWESPFNKNLNVSLCGRGYDGWDHSRKKYVSVAEVRKSLAAFETSSGRNFPVAARVLPHLQAPDVGQCFPDCDRF